MEGTGDPNRQGNTKLGKLDLSTGGFSQEIGLDATHFGEGITILNDKIFQLTYTMGKCMVYDKNTLQPEKDFAYAGEGWEFAMTVSSFITQTVPIEFT